MEADAHSLLACHACGLIQQRPALETGERALCSRCRTIVLDPTHRDGSRARTASAALAALLLYPVAIHLPIMSLERFGYHSEASIWTGTIGMLQDGEWLVGGVVFFCSILLPLAKLIALFALTAQPFGIGRRHQARTYRIVEWAGRWGMLDVLLIALVVTWVKVGDIVEVTPGPGVLAFTLCVLLSLLASARFDPHVLWEQESGPAADQA
jgi:paraquat-inducible protein A